MEKVKSEDALIDLKLKELAERRLKSEDGLIDLRSIQQPRDLAAYHSKFHQAAFDRNMKFLEEVEVASGKLHARRLCPIEDKLNRLKKKYFQETTKLLNKK